MIVPQRPLLILVAALPLALAGPVHAQHEIEQVSAAGDTVGATQVSSETRAIDLPVRAARDTAPAPQLSNTGQSTSATNQLTPSGESSSAPAQLYRGGRTAQAAAPLSTPAEGRPGDVTRVEGDDRCEPGTQTRLSVCARVIETRSAEFDRARPALSAEQRLLIEQQRSDATSAQAAARRLAGNAADPNSLEDQSIASIVLRIPEPVRQEPDEVPTEDAAALQAIVESLAATPR